MPLPHPDVRRARLVEQWPSWQPMTISALLARAAKDHAERPLVIGPDRTLCYADVDAQSRQLASGLIACGIQPGQHIALDMANYPEFAIAKFAIARAGCVCVPINFLLRGRELAYILAQSDTRLLLTMDAFRGHDYLADLAAVRGDMPTLDHVFAFATGEPNIGDAPGFADLVAMATAESDAELARREGNADPMALCDVIYTSGTTGRPKGVMLTHDMVLRSAWSSVIHRAFEDGRRIQFAMPMYHVFGYVECLIASLYVGGAIIPHTIFDPLEMLEAAERHGTNELVCVPMMTHKLIDLARTRGFDAPAFNVMFNSGGVNVPSVWGDIRAVLGASEVITAYGMTETTASTTCTLPEGADEHLLTSNGRLKLASAAGAADLDDRVALYKVIDPATGADLPFGNEGELVVKGPVVTRGYYKKPEETEAAFTPDGWLHTGDVGKLTDDGFLSLTGRIKEAYRCGGEMVMPREIEELFDDDPLIATALVVGVPDAKMGEVGCLCIVPRGSERPAPAMLIDRCSSQLARFKIPKHVLFLDASDIPLTVTGRPQKFLLAKVASGRIESAAVD